jgi:hypothetical protein
MSPIQWRRYSDEARLRKVGPSPDDNISPAHSKPASRSSHRDANAEESDDASSFGNVALNINDAQFENGFDFGSLIETMQETNEASLAHRVATLEVKLMDLEFAIAKLQSHDPSPLQHSTSERKSHTSKKLSAPATESESHSSSISGTLDTRHTPPRSSPADDGRPESIVTIRPQTSGAYHPSSRISRGPPPNPDFHGISVEQYSALTMLVRREQTARKLLETQIIQLRNEVEKLQKGGSRIFDPESFFRPSSPDSVEDPSSPVIDSPSTSKHAKSRKDGRDKRITGSFRRHHLSTRSFYSDSDRPPADSKHRMPGMI